MNIKITFKKVQEFHQNGCNSQGMFIFCDVVKISGKSLIVYSDKDLNFFAVNDVVKIELT